MKDILSALETLFDIGSEQKLDLNVVNKEGNVSCLNDPSLQLFDGVVIDIRKKAAPNKENESLNTPIKEEEESGITSEFSVSIDVDDNEANKNKNDEQKEQQQKGDKETKQIKTENEESGKQQVRCPRFIARLRGLPWSARESDISEFFCEESVKEVQIVYLTDGRASGEALVEFADNKSFQSAFLRNRQHIGHRYIEIFKSTGVEIDTAAG